VKLFYNLFVSVYPMIAKLISGRNAKARLWVEGRKNIFRKLQANVENTTHKVVWFHCSSLGEFEQGRPLMEGIRKQEPNIKIVLTFFSPSGYEVRKNYDGADWIFYLPMDSPSNAKQFLSIVNPSLVVFVKYEFWYYYLEETRKRKIPLLLISGVFRSNQPFFKWYGNFHKKMLQCFTHFFVQNDDSASLLKGIGLHTNVTVTGDTRFDRVIEIAERFDPIALIEQFTGACKVIVAGSTWTEDDEELDHYANTHPEIKFIIAPHDIEEDRLKECLSLYKNSVLFSQLQKELAEMNDPSPVISHPFTQKNVLIIDNMGMLGKLYKYATVCYVGGAFGGDGVHNVLEAAVYNKPVVFGPEYDKYIEAVELVGAGGAFSVDNALELEEVLNKLMKEEPDYQQAATLAGDYVRSKSGAAKKILQFIQENRLLTN